MSSLKAQLKSIGDFIKQSKWDDAIQKAQDVLESDTRNHQAFVLPCPHLG